MQKEIKIGARAIGPEYPAYIIAEIGLNHQGDVKLAKKLIDKAVEAKADCVKFQKRSLKKSFSSHALAHPDDQEHATHYVLGHIIKTELSDEDMTELAAYAASKSVDFLCSPWDEESLMFLNKLGLPAFKIASADMFNLKLIGKAASLKKPLLISTGMSFVSEIEQLVAFLTQLNAEYVLLHCNSTYPAPFHDINLRFIDVLRDRFDAIVGYSGHEQGISVSLAAVARGACVVERHLTLDRTMPGPDHKASLEPDEFSELVKQIRIIELALGNGVRFPSRGEYLNRETLSKSIVASRDLPKGTVLTYEDLDVKGPGKGTSPLKLNLFIGKTLDRDVRAEDYVLESYVNLRPIFDYGEVKAKHPWGVVARMSDIDSMIGCGPDFVELHLTSSDVHANKKYTKKYDVDLAVHGPEYDDDLLLDLSSLDPGIRRRSITFFNKAFAHARKLKPLFRNHDKKIKFVVHPGGMSMEAPLSDRIPELNANLADSLKQLDGEGFELLPENMPGLPWYFGGQWHHANFMDAREILAFCKKHNYGLTLDISHAALYCNYYGKDLTEFVKTVEPVVRYVHISDAANYNGEGIQIGEGTINFKPILDLLTKKRALWFLPEIWQGHKWGGEGFLRAVTKLTRMHQDF